MGLFGGNKMPVDGKTVLITGASEGMGLSAAQKLAARGANVILVSRSASKLEAALQSVKAAAKNPSTQRFHCIPADVSSPSYAAPVLAQAREWNNGRSPDVVWCVAGVSVPELFVDMDMASLRKQMDVNFFGTAEMSHAILREWLAADAPVEKEPRHLVMTTSVVALYTIPGYAPYAPSKWAIRGLADTISQEAMMYPQNVKVHVVYPGSILSPGFERENVSKPDITKILEESDPKQTPDEVAEAAIRGLERGDYFITVNFLGSLMKWGMLGGSFRNNWIVDTLGAWLVSIVWIFVQMDLHGKIRGYGKKHGHPSTYKKHQA
ncbi:3-ketodihydrosphingosine reductase gsl-3 [Purpureocillium lavendulum]|uniref:3-dehydrosphinganine reductase n=1 Tax=Purpureocillium lavendulum TaxID=1247861 RepID=A0AB34G549_9HYPO|nr:3-ketodihydrosphingosine reductase gsl-3 [Purpureocillium lavendulum]